VFNAQLACRWGRGGKRIASRTRRRRKRTEVVATQKRARKTLRGLWIRATASEDGDRGLWYIHHSRATGWFGEPRSDVAAKVSERDVLELAWRSWPTKRREQRRVVDGARFPSDGAISAEVCARLASFDVWG
jgi:hypothetical protein